MDRSTFLLIAGFLAVFFSLNMMFGGSKMLKTMLIPTNQSSLIILQWMGAQLFAIGIITILARKDPGSPALRAVLIGTIVLHALALSVDTLHFVKKFISRGAMVMGAVVHVLIGAGAAYYLMGLPA